MSQESPLFAKTYDLLVYLLPASEKFPRSQRVRAGPPPAGDRAGLPGSAPGGPQVRGSGAADLLRQADVELDRLRYTVRLCHEIDLFSLKQYRHASGLLAEVGRLLGTWMKAV